MQGFGFEASDTMRVFVNGKPVELDGESAVNTVFHACLEQQRELQMNLFRGLLNDSEEDLHAWFLRKHSARPFFSAFSGKSNSDTPFVALADGGKPRMERLTHGLVEVLHWVGECRAYCKLSYVVVADFATRQGLTLVQNMLLRLQQLKQGAVGVRAALVVRSAQTQHARELASELLARWQVRDVCVVAVIVQAWLLTAPAQANSIDGALRLLDTELAGHSHSTWQLSGEIV